MTLNGAVEAAVGGGITKYQEAFLSGETDYSSELVSDLEMVSVEFVSATRDNILDTLD